MSREQFRFHAEDSELASVGPWMKLNRITEMQTFHLDVATLQIDRLLTDRFLAMSVLENRGMHVRYVLTLLSRAIGQLRFLT